ncbi:hypothetical protein ACU4GI_21970 [Cupriavidus basilensis]
MSRKISFIYSGIEMGSPVERAYSRLIQVFQVAGEDCERVFDRDDSFPTGFKELQRLRRQDAVVFANVWQILKYSILFVGARARLVFWVQGLVAEESFLKRRSTIRFLILKLIEKICFVIVDDYIFVSKYMMEYYLKGDSKGRRRGIVVPCVSDLVPDRNIRRRKHSFCYVGGMALWQRFDVIVQIMNKVVGECERAKFYVATREIDKCMEILSRLGSPGLVSRTEIVSLKTDKEISEFLSGMEFGFLIRDDNEINNVASPIKLAEYLSCGVRVIMTSAVRSYIDVLGDAAFVTSIDAFRVAEVVDSGMDLSDAAERAMMRHRAIFSLDSAAAEVAALFVEKSSVETRV